jgi:hypothetical protein
MTQVPVPTATLFECDSPEGDWKSVEPNADTVNEYISGKPYVNIEAPALE